MSHSPGFRASRVREAQGSQRKNSEIYVVCGIRMHLSAYFKTFRTQNTMDFHRGNHENGENRNGEKFETLAARYSSIAARTHCLLLCCVAILARCSLSGSVAFGGTPLSSDWSGRKRTAAIPDQSSLFSPGNYTIVLRAEKNIDRGRAGRTNTTVWIMKVEIKYIARHTKIRG